MDRQEQASAPRTRVGLRAARAARAWGLGAPRLGALLAALITVGAGGQADAQSVAVDASPAGRRQIIDGFGTATSPRAQEAWYQELYLDDLGASIARWDVSPRFREPYSTLRYYSPGFGGELRMPGPEGNNVRTYRSAADYSREFAGMRAPIAVMGPDIERNIQLFDYADPRPASAGAIGRAALARRAALGDFKLMGTTFSPAPWLKIASGTIYSGSEPTMPRQGTPYPFIWNGNFSGGHLDVSGVPLAEFHDGIEPTSALTQYARSTAAYLLGFQRVHGVPLYAVSIQNELNFEQFFDSCGYPLTHQFAAAIKALRAELDRHPELRNIQIIGPEDLLIDSPYSLWQFGGGPTTIHKNLRYLYELRMTDTAALSGLGFIAVHGQPGDQAWRWFAYGWDATPTGTLPSRLPGFTSYRRKSWLTETSGDTSTWPRPQDGAAEQGALALAIHIHRALVVGQQSAWLHWQFEEGPAGIFSLTDPVAGTTAPKYVAAKHFFRPIRPNAQRVEARVADAAGLLASAYVHDRDRSVTVVLINTSGADRAVPVALGGLPFGVGRYRTFTSSAGVRWVEGAPSGGGTQPVVAVPAYGIVTLVGTP